MLRKPLGRLGQVHGRWLLEYSGELFDRRRGTLEGVVELADVGDRLEEPAQVEDERREHADLHVTVDDPQAAVEQHDRRRDVADQPNAGPVERQQLERRRHRLPVVLVEAGEDLVVARLSAERMHRTNAAHGRRFLGGRLALPASRLHCHYLSPQQEARECPGATTRSPRGWCQPSRSTALP